MIIGLNSYAYTAFQAWVKLIDFLRAYDIKYDILVVDTNRTEGETFALKIKDNGIIFELVDCTKIPTSNLYVNPDESCRMIIIYDRDEAEFRLENNVSNNRKAFIEYMINIINNDYKLYDTDNFSLWSILTGKKKQWVDVNNSFKKFLDYMKNHKKGKIERFTPPTKFDKNHKPLWVYENFMENCDKVICKLPWEEDDYFGYMKQCYGSGGNGLVLTMKNDKFTKFIYFFL